MLRRICNKISGRSQSNDLTSPLLLHDDDNDGNIIRRTTIQLSKTFHITQNNPQHNVDHDSDLDELDYSMQDDVEIEYTTTRVFLRHDILNQWSVSEDALLDDHYKLVSDEGK